MYVDFILCLPSVHVQAFYARVAAGRDVEETLHIYQSVHLASQHLLAYSAPVQAKRNDMA